MLNSNKPVAVASMVLFLCSFTIFSLFHIESVKTTELHDLHYYETVDVHKVNHLNTKRTRRDIWTLNNHEDENPNEASFFFKGYGRDFNILLYRNDILLPPSFEILSQHPNLTYRTHPHVNRCYYHGYLTDRKSSSVVVSTCNGLDGFIKDEDDEEFVIQPLVDHTGLRHILYNRKDIIQDQDFATQLNSSSDQEENKSINRKGLHRQLNEQRQNKVFQRENNIRYKDNIILEMLSQKLDSKVRWVLTAQAPEVHQRSRRSASTTKYIEFVCIVDHAEYEYYYKKHGNDVEKGKTSNLTHYSIICC